MSEPTYEETAHRHVDEIANLSVRNQDEATDRIEILISLLDQWRVAIEDEKNDLDRIERRFTDGWLG